LGFPGFFIGPSRFFYFFRVATLPVWMSVDLDLQCIENNFLSDASNIAEELFISLS